MDTNRPSLLIAEDDERMRDLIAEAARRANAYASITAVADGQAAIEFLHAQVAARQPLPDFILSDLAMPRADGLALLHALRERDETKDIPVAIMTSSNRPNDRHDATAAGCCAFFHKPIRIEELVTLVASLPRICGSNAIATAASPRNAA